MFPNSPAGLVEPFKGQEKRGGALKDTAVRKQRRINIKYLEWGLCCLRSLPC